LVKATIGASRQRDTTARFGAEQPPAKDTAGSITIPPKPEPEKWAYHRYIAAHTDQPEARFILILALAPHLQPAILRNFQHQALPADFGGVVNERRQHQEQTMRDDRVLFHFRLITTLVWL
jgi:hypothetical protein